MDQWPPVSSPSASEVVSTPSSEQLSNTVADTPIEAITPEMWHSMDTTPNESMAIDTPQSAQNIVPQSGVTPMVTDDVAQAPVLAEISENNQEKVDKL